VVRFQDKVSGGFQVTKLTLITCEKAIFYLSCQGTCTWKSICQGTSARKQRKDFSSFNEAIPLEDPLLMHWKL